jgi:hypothetical protein
MDVQKPRTVLKELAGVKALRELVLMSGEWTDACLDELAGLKQLQSLTVPGSITKKGVRKLGERLPGCTITRFPF